MAMSKPVANMYAELLATEFVNGGYESYAAFSRELGRCDRWFSDFISKYPETREYIDKAMRNRIKELASAALETETSLLHAESETVRLNAAKDLLSRSGYDAAIKQEITTNEIEINIK